MIIDILEKKLNEVLDYEIDFTVIKSNRPELCDYQSDDLFKLAKILKRSPLDIESEIVLKLNEIEDFNKYFKKIEFATPGFINITVSDSLINEVLTYMSSHDKFGLELDKPETFILDYGGPNVAKPLHVGHMRTAIVGESIKRIINYMGHKTIADVHLGDYGLQIGEVIYGILQDKPKEITIEYLEKTYPKISTLCKLSDDVKEKCALITKELQDGNEEYQKLWKKILEVSSNDIKRLYNYLGVSFDLWQGESDAYKYIDVLKEYLDKQELLKNSEGALIMDIKESTDTKEIPPFIFQKSNGAYLYSTTDLATIYERVEKYNPNHILYVVDNRQNLHFEQVFRAARKSKIANKIDLAFLGYGTVNGMDGKPYKTRSGNTPKLDDLFKEVKDIFLEKKEENKNMSDEDLDKIVNAILKFADLQNARERDYIFDIQKFSNVVGKTGPYILYTYLRIDKILKQSEFNGLLNGGAYNDVDRNLRLKLTEFNLALNSAFKEYKPSYIADYIYNLAVCANNFYQNNHVISENNEITKSDWLFVLNLTNKVLKELLNLIIIEIPSQM